MYYTHEKRTQDLGNGITAQIRIVEDEYPDLSHLGEFTNKYQDGAIDHHKELGYTDHRTYRYFVPGITESDHYKGLRGMGYTHLGALRMARKYVKQDYKRARTYGDQWSMTAVLVDLMVDGVEVSRSSLWGIESDSGADYYDRVIADCIADCLADAKLESDKFASIASKLGELA